MAGFDIYASWVAVAVIVAVFITYINIRGAKTAAFLQTVLTVIIGVVGILLVVASLFSGDMSNIESQLFVGDSTASMARNVFGGRGPDAVLLYRF